MTPISSNQIKAEDPVIAVNPPQSLVAEYEAAMNAYNEQVTFMLPTRKRYNVAFRSHSQVQKRYNKIMDKMTSHRITYQRHKQYFISLSNALLTSNITFRSTTIPLGDSQMLTYATLVHNHGIASHMLRTMILQDKRLEKARDESWRVDQKLYARCQELFVEVDKECRELDRRHAKVLEAEEKMGGNPKCGNADEECASCVRLKEREAGTKAAEEMMVKEKKEGECCWQKATTS